MENKKTSHIHIGSFDHKSKYSIENATQNIRVTEYFLS